MSHLSDHEQHSNVPPEGEVAPGFPDGCAVPAMEAMDDEPCCLNLQRIIIINLQYLYYVGPNKHEAYMGKLIKTKYNFNINIGLPDGGAVPAMEAIHEEPCMSNIY